MTNIIAVGIPKEANYFKLMGSSFQRGRVEVEYRVYAAFRFNFLSESDYVNNYSILGRLSELTEEQCKGLVESIDSDRGEVYKAYDKDFQGAFHWTAKESFNSKLKSELQICKSMFADEDDFIAQHTSRFMNHLGNPDDDSIQVQQIYNRLPDDLLVLIQK